MWPVKLLTCQTDRTWDDRIENGLQPLLEPRNIFYRDLPLSTIVNGEMEGDSLMVNGVRVNDRQFTHTNSDGGDLVGEVFTWEHRDPRHCFANTYNWGIEIFNGYGLTTPARADADGLDFLYPRMLIAHVSEGPLPLIENNTFYTSLPAVGASIKYRINV
jgi:hypothetical protein